MKVLISGVSPNLRDFPLTLDTLTRGDSYGRQSGRAQLRESYSTPPMLIRNPNSP